MKATYNKFTIPCFFDSESVFFTVSDKCPSLDVFLNLVPAQLSRGGAYLSGDVCSQSDILDGVATGAGGSLNIELIIKQ